MISNNYKQNKLNFIMEHEKCKTRQLVVVARAEKVNWLEKVEKMKAETSI